MSVLARFGLAVLLLGSFVSVAPAKAQTSPSEPSGSSWTDPPVRGAAAPEGPALAKPTGTDGSAIKVPEAEAAEPKTPAAAEAPAKPDIAKPAQSAGAPAPATPAERAAAVLGVKPVAGGQNTAAARSWSPAARPVVRPPFVAAWRAAPARAYRLRQVERRPRYVQRRSIVERPRLAARRELGFDRPARRLASGPRRAYRTYAWAPEAETYDRDDLYDRPAYAPGWSGRRLAGWRGLLGDERASRIAQARAAGYTVMRMQTFQYSDGSRERRFLPFLPGGFGDPD